jgi:hypothetical protein
MFFTDIPPSQYSKYIINQRLLEKIRAGNVVNVIKLTCGLQGTVFIVNAIFNELVCQNFHEMVAFLLASKYPVGACSVCSLTTAVMRRHVKMLNLLICSDYLNNVRSHIPQYFKLIKDILNIAPLLAGFIVKYETRRFPDQQIPPIAINCIIQNENLSAIEDVVDKIGKHMFLRLRPDTVRSAIFNSININFINRLVELIGYLPNYFSQQDFDDFCCINDACVSNTIIDLLLEKGFYSVTKMHASVFIRLGQNKFFNRITRLITKGLDRLFLPGTVDNKSNHFSHAVFEALVAFYPSNSDSELIQRLLATGRYSLVKMASETFQRLTMTNDTNKLNFMLRNNFDILRFPWKVYSTNIGNNSGLAIISELNSLGYSPEKSNTFNAICSTLSQTLEYLLPFVSAVRATKNVLDESGNIVSVLSSSISLCTIEPIMSYLRPSQPLVGVLFETFLFNTFVFRVNLSEERLGFICSWLNQMISRDYCPNIYDKDEVFFTKEK